MSLEKNNEFLVAFNILDDMLKDMYPNDVPSKLGVTRYLDDMKSKEDDGIYRIDFWKADYDRLRKLRNNRTKVVHDNMLADDVFDDRDVAWIKGFTNRIKTQKDPLSMLYQMKKKQTKPKAKPKATPAKNKTKAQLERELRQDNMPRQVRTYRAPKEENTGRSGSAVVVIAMVFVVLCIIGCVIGWVK